MGNQSALTIYKSHNLNGTIEIAGDIIISQLALIIASLTINGCKISNLRSSRQVLTLIKALQQLGATIYPQNNVWHIYGLSNGALIEAKEALDFTADSSALPLLMGLVSSYTFRTEFMADKALEQPIISLFQQMGAQIKITAKPQNLIIGPSNGSAPISYNLIEDLYDPANDYNSIKMALCLAALNTAGITSIIEPKFLNCHNHIERLLPIFGATIDILTKQQSAIISLKGQTLLKAADITIPGDPDAAALFIMAALITPGSDITLKDILVNPARIGYIKLLLAMNANIKLLNQKLVNGEEVADIQVKTSKLTAIEINAQNDKNILEIYPILALAASSASGTTILHGSTNLTSKQAKSLNYLIQGLRGCGVKVKQTANSISITGSAMLEGGALIDANDEPYIAMMFSILGLMTQAPISINQPAELEKYFPNFIQLLCDIGAKLHA